MSSFPVSLAVIGQVCLIANVTEWNLSSNSIFSRSRNVEICEPNVIPDDYTVVSNIGAYKVHTASALWNDARKVCESEGAHLAVINSAEESAAIRDVIAAAGEYTDTHDTNYTLIGFHNLYDEADFITIYGSTLENAGFAVWAENEPDNQAQREYCGSVHNEDGLLNDIDCNRTFGYICELNDIFVAW